MKRIAVIVFTLFVGVVGYAQNDTDTLTVSETLNNVQPSVNNVQPSVVNEIIIGYLSYDSALVAMPDYAIVMKKMADTRTAYNEEMKRVENEFNTKYEEFLENRKDYPRTILLKRQTELQELLERNIAFKNEGRRDLRNQEKELMAPLRARLNEVVAEVAREQGLIIVVNTDADACPFIEPQMSVDLTEEVIRRLME